MERIGRGKKIVFSYEELCHWAGGERYLKALRDPRTGEPYFGRGKNPFPNYKQPGRGFPQHFVIDLLMDRLDRMKRNADDAQSLSTQLHAFQNHPSPEVRAISASVVKILTVKGAESPEWKAVTAVVDVLSPLPSG